MKKYTIYIHEGEDNPLNGLIDINSENLLYTGCYMGFGMQCSFDSDDERYNKIMEICERIENDMRQLDKLNSK